MQTESRCEKCGRATPRHRATDRASGTEAGADGFEGYCACDKPKGAVNDEKQEFSFEVVNLYEEPRQVFGGIFGVRFERPSVVGFEAESSGSPASDELIAPQQVVVPVPVPFVPTTLVVQGLPGQIPVKLGPGGQLLDVYGEPLVIHAPGPEWPKPRDAEDDDDDDDDAPLWQSDEDEEPAREAKALERIASALEKLVDQSFFITEELKRTRAKR